MTDTLRDRIAAVIYEASDEYTRKLMVNPRLPGCSDIEGDCKPVCFTLADAVIEALALRQEYDPYVEPESSRYRYVTEWTTND